MTTAIGEKGKRKEKVSNKLARVCVSNLFRYQL